MSYLSHAYPNQFTYKRSSSNQSDMIKFKESLVAQLEVQKRIDISTVS